MTLYAYRCRDCCKRWSEDYRMGTAPGRVTCPSCELMEGVRDWSTVHLAEVKGTGNGKVGRKIEERLEKNRNAGHVSTEDAEVEAAVKVVEGEEGVAKWRGEI